MYSALHSAMQWFSQLLDERTEHVFTPKIKRKFFDVYILWIKTNVAYTRLEMIAKTKYCTKTTASNWIITLYYKLLPAVRSSSKHGRRWSSLLLYSYLWMWSSSLSCLSLVYRGHWSRSRHLVDRSTFILCVHALDIRHWLCASCSKPRNSSAVQ